MEVTLQLQIIAIFMGVIGVALPALIAIVAFVYVRQINERIDNLAADVDDLWDHVKKKTIACQMSLSASLDSAGGVLGGPM